MEEATCENCPHWQAQEEPYGECSIAPRGIDTHRSHWCSHHPALADLDPGYRVLCNIERLLKEKEDECGKQS